LSQSFAELYAQAIDAMVVQAGKTGHTNLADYLLQGHDLAAYLDRANPNATLSEKELILESAFAIILARSSPGMAQARLKYVRTLAASLNAQQAAQ
jgi:hypothetical protein